MLFARARTRAVTADDVAAHLDIHRSVARSRLDRLAHRLLETETLDEDDAYAAAGVDRAAADTGDSYSVAARSRVE